MSLFENKMAVSVAILLVFLIPADGLKSGNQDQSQKPEESTKTPNTKSRPMRITIGGNVAAARIVSRVQPLYPKKAREQKIAGTVRLHVVIGTDGSVQEVAAISGDPILADAAVEAVRQWKYQVTTLNKEPVEVDTTVDVIFSLTP